MLKLHKDLFHKFIEEIFVIIAINFGDIHWNPTIVFLLVTMCNILL